jgi:hypothetical protein
MPRPKHEIKIKLRKLGREKNWGQAWQDGSMLIEVDPRQPEKKLICVALHESLHVVFPELSETKVDKAAWKIARLLWRMGYRRIRE